MLGNFSRLLRRKRRPNRRNDFTICREIQVLEDRALLALTISPVYDKSLNDLPNSVEIKSAINSAIQQVQAHVANTMQVKVVFQAHTASINSIRITKDGNGYSDTKPPAVVIDPPTTSAANGGRQATAQAYVESGQVGFIRITDPGFGYTTPPKVRIDGATESAAAVAELDYGVATSFTNTTALTYSELVSALNAQTPKSSNDATALQLLPTANPFVLGTKLTDSIRLTYPLARALGRNVTNPLPWDGVISLNTDILSDTRSDGDPKKFDLQTVVMRELIEILDGGSGLTGGGPGNEQQPMPLDLFRYDADGFRRYDYYHNTKATVFSIDHKTVLAQFDQISDYGAWDSPHDTEGNLLSPAGPQVLDANPTWGATPNLGVAELTRLDVLGYTLNNNLPDLTLSVSNNVNGSTTDANPWTWKLHVANAGSAAATFTAGQTILTDNLPYAQIKYGTVKISNAVNITGASAIAPAIDLSGNVVVTAGSQVVIQPGGSFDVEIPVTTVVAGKYTNPRSEGTAWFTPVAMVDPNGVIAEKSEQNKAGSNTVNVTAQVQPTRSLYITNAPDIPGHGQLQGTGIDDGDQIELYIRDPHGHQTRAVYTTVGGGTWAINVDSIDTSMLEDGWIEYRVNEYGNPGGAWTATALKGNTLDFTNAPDITKSNVKNLSASGVGGVNGDIISVSIVDANGKSFTAYTSVSGGMWSLSGMNAEGLADGPVTWTARETSLVFLFEYKPSQKVSVAATKDATTIVPPLTISTAPNITKTNQYSLSVNGTGESGNTIEVTITDGAAATNTATTTVNSGGAWSVSGIDASMLADGPVTYIVNATDSGGNANTVTASRAKDAITPVVVTASTAKLPANATVLVIRGSGFDPIAVNNRVLLSSGTARVTAATATTLTVSVTGIASGPLYAVVAARDVVSDEPVQVAAVTPVITSSTATVLANAQSLIIKGYGFSAIPANNTVLIGSATGTVSSATTTQLTITNLPGLVAGYLSAAVTVAGQSSGAVRIATVQPVVTASTASLANNATTLTISGVGFSTTPQYNAVVFNGGATGKVTAATRTSLTVTAITGLAVGPLTVAATTNAVTSSTVQVATVTAVASPVLTSSTTFLPVTATTIILRGSGFAAAPAGNVVTFSGGVTGTVTAATGTQLTVTNLTGLATGNLSALVKVSGKSSSVVPVAKVGPVVTASTANLANNATTLVISGFGFSTTPQYNAVVFSGGAKGTVTAATATQLTVTGITGLAVGPLTATVTTSAITIPSSVQVAMVTSAAPPVVTTSSAVLLANATTLVIRGSGFAGLPASNTVKFTGGVTGTVTSATGTQLTISNLTGLVAGNLMANVTVSGKVSSTVQVAKVQPVVTASTANLANNVTTLTISGFGFSSTPAYNAVTLNSGATGKVTAATATTLTVTGVKGLAVGTLTATVMTNAVSSASAVQVATVVSVGPPVVTSSSAVLLANTATLVIRGSGFAALPAGNTVKFNGSVTGTVASATATQLTITNLTGLVAGNLVANVTVSGKLSTTVQVAKVQPVVTASTANLANNATTLTITGFGFSSTPAYNAVTFSGGATGKVTGATATTLTVTGIKGLAIGTLTATVMTNAVSSASAVQLATVVSVASPVVTSSTAALAANATTLVIRGSGFAALPASNTVKFNGTVTGTVASATGTQLTITNLTGLVAGNLTAFVTVSGKVSSTVQVAKVQPVVTASTANLAINATTLTISGFGFSSNAASNTVVLSGGATGTVTSATATSLTVTGITGLPVGSLTATVTSNSVSSGSAVQVSTVVPPPATLDVSVTTVESTVGLTAAYYGQSFVPTVSGLLTQLNLLYISDLFGNQSQSLGATSAILQIYQGGKVTDPLSDSYGQPAGSLLYSETFTLTPRGTNNVVFTHPPTLVANQMYVWKLVGDGVGAINSQWAANNPYPQGEMLGAPGQPYDLPFETYMAAAEGPSPTPPAAPLFLAASPARESDTPTVSPAIAVAPAETPYSGSIIVTSPSRSTRGSVSLSVEREPAMVGENVIYSIASSPFDSTDLAAISPVVT